MAARLRHPPSRRQSFRDAGAAARCFSTWFVARREPGRWKTRPLVFAAARPARQRLGLRQSAWRSAQRKGFRAWRWRCHAADGPPGPPPFRRELQNSLLTPAVHPSVAVPRCQSNLTCSTAPAVRRKEAGRGEFPPLVFCRSQCDRVPATLRAGCSFAAWRSWHLGGLPVVSTASTGCRRKPSCPAGHRLQCSWMYHPSSRSRAHGVFRRNVSADLTLGLWRKQRIGMRAAISAQPCRSTICVTMLSSVTPCSGSRGGLGGEGTGAKISRRLLRRDGDRRRRGSAAVSFQENDARNHRDDRRLEPGPDDLWIGAAPSHFKQTREKPFAALRAPHIDRQRPGGLGQLGSPFGQISLAPHPHFARIAFGARIPRQPQTQTHNHALPVDDKIRRGRLSAELRAHRVKLITFADNMWRSRRRRRRRRCWCGRGRGCGSWCGRGRGCGRGRMIKHRR